MQGLTTVYKHSVFFFYIIRNRANTHKTMRYDIYYFDFVFLIRHLTENYVLITGCYFVFINKEISNIDESNCLLRLQIRLHSIIAK